MDDMNELLEEARRLIERAARTADWLIDEVSGFTYKQSPVHSLRDAARAFLAASTVGRQTLVPSTPGTPGDGEG